MNICCKNRRRYQRGGILLTTLAFTVVISLLLAGIATLTVSHYGRIQVETDYQIALDLAEAGVNYEFRKISANTANADQTGSSNPPGSTYNLELNPQTDQLFGQYFQATERETYEVVFSRLK